MRSVFDNDTIQIEITNACILECANCTRFVGHRKPYFMAWDTFKEAVDSMVGYPFMTGVMGGEPLLHPQFEKFCDYAVEKLGKEHLGLWTCFPKGYEKYRDIICRTFYHIFLNDHTRTDIYHHPFLVAAEEMIKDRRRMFLLINECWAQESWSASINPKGAFFCEIAASLSLLFNGSDGWNVAPEWWTRTVKDYTSQIEEFCPQCGGSLPLHRRKSIDDVDDISPKNLEKLKGKSRKIDAGKYIISEMKPVEPMESLAAYKEENYRARIAGRYGIFLVTNDYFGSNKLFWTPYLKKDFNSLNEKKPIFMEYKEIYG
jgi:hypothetical protein